MDVLNHNLLKIPDVANRLGCSSRHVRRLINHGELSVISIGTTRKGDRVDPKDLEMFIRKKRINRGDISWQFSKGRTSGTRVSLTQENELSNLLEKGRQKNKHKS